MTEKLEYVLMDVKNFGKEWGECETFEEKFLYYLKNLPRFAQKPSTGGDGYFEEMLAAAEYQSMEEEIRINISKRLKMLHDSHNVEAYMKKQAREEGRAEGRAEGNLANARKMHALGIDADIIFQVTGIKEKDL